MNNPSESIDGWRGGQVRPVRVFRHEPLSPGPRVTERQAWSDVPTCAGQGVAVDEYRMPRTVFLPPAVPAPAQAYWIGVLRRVAETPGWQEYLQRTSQSGVFLAPGEMCASMGREEGAARELYGAEGRLVKQVGRPQDSKRPQSRGEAPDGGA